MIEYQSREYCRNTGCIIQIYLDGPRKNAKNSSKKYCRESCEAYKFHKWLQDNGYKILKEE